MKAQTNLVIGILVGIVVGYFSPRLFDGGVKLKAFSYVLYSSPDIRDRICIADSDSEDVAQANCDAVKSWHEKLYPNSGSFCRLLR
jgi:hypothetical protein